MQVMSSRSWPVPGRTIGRLGDDLGDVADGVTLLGAQGADAVLEHGHAERAGHRHAPCTGGERLLESVVADARAALLLHEGTRAACPPAEAAVPTARQFGETALDMP